MFLLEKHPQKVNLFAYCDNDPANESDSEGSVITAILRKILLGFIKGFLKQLCSDILVWLVRKVVFNKHEKFRLKTEEYIASILEGIFSEFSLFQVIGSTIKIICIVVKYLPKLFGGRMRGSDWGNLLLEIIAVFINILLNSRLSKIKTQRNLLAKKRMATSNIKIQPSISQLTVKIRVFNVNLQTAIPITQTILSFIISVLRKGIYGLSGF